ncbi:hypothetical protein Nmel_005611 [Mimus melanotis]
MYTSMTRKDQALLTTPLALD